MLQSELTVLTDGRTYKSVDVRYLPEADIVESLVVNAVGLVGVLHELVHRQSRVVRLHHGVRHLSYADRYVDRFIDR